VLDVMLVPMLGRLDDCCRLVPKLLGEFLVPWPLLPRSIS
jgi:hypothetical protein